MKGFNSKTLFYSVAVVIWVSYLGGANAEMTKEPLNLPNTIDVWTRSNSVRIIDSRNIFDYMDGAGELYLAYRFDRLEVYEYTADQELLVRLLLRRLQPPLPRDPPLLLLLQKKNNIGPFKGHQILPREQTMYTYCVE